MVGSLLMSTICGWKENKKLLLVQVCFVPAFSCVLNGYIPKSGLETFEEELQKLKNKLTKYRTFELNFMIASLARVISPVPNARQLVSLLLLLTVYRGKHYNCTHHILDYPCAVLFKQTHISALNRAHISSE